MDKKGASELAKVARASVVVRTYRVVLAVETPQNNMEAVKQAIERCLQSHYSGVKATIEDIEQTS